MAFPTFSILTPFHVHSPDRNAQLQRAIDSVKHQTYAVEGKNEGLWEHILINDGSRAEFDLPDYPWMKKLEQDHMERMIALNLGFENVENEWIVFLDSDDMLSPYFLETCAQMISKYPDVDVFNFGSVYFHPSYSVSLRAPFRPKKLDVGHELFTSGQIVNGTYIFKKSCYDELGGFPHVTNPWDFSEEAQKEFPELVPHFTIINEDNPDGVIHELGNPVGQDYYYFYKLTRKYHSMPLDVYLYMVFNKGQRRLKL